MDVHARQDHRRGAPVGGALLRLRKGGEVGEGSERLLDDTHCNRGERGARKGGVSEHRQRGQQAGL